VVNAVKLWTLTANIGNSISELPAGIRHIGELSLLTGTNFSGLATYQALQERYTMGANRYCASRLAATPAGGVAEFASWRVR